MKTAGVAWVISGGLLNNQSAMKTDVRSVARASEGLSTGISTKALRERTHSPMQNFKVRRWTRQVLFLLRSSANSIVGITKKIPSLPGQRDIDLLQAMQCRQEQQGGGEIPVQPDADELRKVRADALVREKIMSHRYTGH